MNCGIYLYGIFPLPGPQELKLQGLDKQPVLSQKLDNFIFLYSQALQEKYLASRRNLLGHERVLEEAIKAGYRTVLPLRFGLIVEGWEAISEQLVNPYKEHLDRLFLKLDGRREVGVKVFWEPQAELQQLLLENPELKAKRDRLEGKPLSMDEVIGMGQILERSLQVRQQGIIEEFASTLNPFAIEVAENDLLTETMIYNAAYLIPWDDEERFGEQVETLDRKFDSRLRIRYNNFTAPFNFAQLET